jgi:hypothetical protein
LPQFRVTRKAEARSQPEEPESGKPEGPESPQVRVPGGGPAFTRNLNGWPRLRGRCSRPGPGHRDTGSRPDSDREFEEETSSGVQCYTMMPVTVRLTVTRRGGHDGHGTVSYAVTRRRAAPVTVSECVTVAAAAMVEAPRT